MLNCNPSSISELRHVNMVVCEQVAVLLPSDNLPSREQSAFSNLGSLRNNSVFLDI